MGSGNLFEKNWLGRFVRQVGATFQFRCHLSIFEKFRLCDSEITYAYTFLTTYVERTSGQVEVQSIGYQCHFLVLQTMYQKVERWHRNWKVAPTGQVRCGLDTVMRWLMPLVSSQNMKNSPWTTCGFKKVGANVMSLPYSSNLVSVPPFNFGATFQFWCHLSTFVKSDCVALRSLMPMICSLFMEKRHVGRHRFNR